MATINAEEVRVPRWVRDAVARHEHVVVLNRERPVLTIVHPDALERRPRRRGRPVREVAAMLAGIPSPAPDFAADMEAVLDSVGPVPGAPWEPS